MLFALPLTQEEYSKIQKQKRTETVVFEICSPESIAPFQMVGAQFDRYITDQVYIGGTAYGAISGGRGGYALGSFNVGYRVGEVFFIDTKVMIGGSGGGGVPVKGGLLIEPVITLGFQLLPDVEIRFGLGKYFSLDNDFRADIYQLGISFDTWHLYLP